MDETKEEIPKKTPKQLEKEAKKLAKLEKFKQKQELKNIKVDAIPREKKEKKETTKEIIEYSGNTVPGEKKDVSTEMPKAYSPAYVEASWYSWWEKEGFFKPEYGRKTLKENNTKGKFVMVIPPPNVTGTLHVGHALTNSIEDALTRWNRMKGRLTLWNPGCDHAGIATQVVVEKKLWREHKKTRHDIGREEFIKKIWEWKNEKGDKIYTQLRSIGSSLDWDRARFTMDERCSKAVIEAFVRLHENGDIYRSNRLVNWSCTLKSAISDIEVDKVELPGRTLLSVPGYENKIEFGILVHFAYEIDLGNANIEKEFVIVATTRIETMLGDTAIAVHPNDERYTHLHGKFVKHPFCDRKLPIICDNFVEMDFGTGVVKITPAHDPNDYEVGIRHNLPFITIFSDDGKIIGDCESFVGMKRFEARQAVLKALEVKGLFREIKDNPMIVPVCNRSKDIVEPLIKPQWYVKCDEMAKDAVEAVKSGKLKLVPEHHIKIWYHWMENIRDWCISRQLWWGHRIPAYRVFTDEPSLKTKFEQEEFWVSGRSLEEAILKATKKYCLPMEKVKLEQDPDVLDTWFSSGLFPFSVFGWPDKTDDMEVFYPNTLLETGHDILFFWVARMVFLGQRLLNKLPFEKVFLHPMVRDAHGRKMSKSLGNVVDPIDVIRGITLEKLHEQLYESNLDPKEIQKAKEGQKQDYPNGIPECGTDALRFALCAYMSQGRDINLDILRVQGYRFFCNKLWNAVRFARSYLNDFTPAEISAVRESDNRCNRERLAVELQKHCLWLRGNNLLLKNGNALAVLNEHFASFSYLNGFQLSDADFIAFSCLYGSGDGINELKPYPYLQRWQTHVLYHYGRRQTRKFQNSHSINLWILSRLSVAVEVCNKGFENFDLNAVTTACYNLWLYELCDVYLECLKPIFAFGDDEAKFDARQTLLHVLDTGLRLLCPFMPYITEELYQRLPIYKPAPSICVAPYPETENFGKWRNVDIEREVQFVQEIVHTLRSAQTNYNLPKSKTSYHRDEKQSGEEKPEVEAFLHCTDETLSAVLNNYLSVIKTLAQWSKLEINEVPPLGCAVLTISDKCQIHLALKGSIDVDKELQKLSKNKETILLSISKLEKIIISPSYESKVPVEIRSANSDKLTQLKGELTKLEEAEKALTYVLNPINTAG